MCPGALSIKLVLSQSKKQTMFPVAHTHCICANNLHFFNTYTWKNALNKMIFLPEHVENISYVYVVDQHIWDCFWLIWKTNSANDFPVSMILFLCAFHSVLLMQRFLIAVFLLIKWKIKNHIMDCGFWTYFWKHTCVFFYFGLYSPFWKVYLHHWSIMNLKWTHIV